MHSLCAEGRSTVGPFASASLRNGSAVAVVALIEAGVLIAYSCACAASTRLMRQLAHLIFFCFRFLFFSHALMLANDAVDALLLLLLPLEMFAPTPVDNKLPAARHSAFVFIHSTRSPVIRMLHAMSHFLHFSYDSNSKKCVVIVFVAAAAWLSGKSCHALYMQPAFFALLTHRKFAAGWLLAGCA